MRKTTAPKMLHLLRKPLTPTIRTLSARIIVQETATGKNAEIIMYKECLKCHR
jgi:hypothetical protein